MSYNNGTKRTGNKSNSLFVSSNISLNFYAYIRSGHLPESAVTGTYLMQMNKFVICCTTWYSLHEQNVMWKNC